MVSLFEKELQTYAALDVSLDVNIMLIDTLEVLKKITEVKSIKTLGEGIEKIKIKWRYEFALQLASIVSFTIPFKIHKSKRIHKVDIYFGIVDKPDFKIDFLILSDKFLRGRTPIIAEDWKIILIKPFRPHVESDLEMSPLELEVEEWVSVTEKIDLPELTPGEEIRKNGWRKYYCYESDVGKWIPNRRDGINQAPAELTINEEIWRLPHSISAKENRYAMKTAFEIIDSDYKL